MSRAMNLKLAEKDVVDKCKSAGVIISAIEPLPSGGTHLVCLTSEGAVLARTKFKSQIIEGRVKRFPFFVPYSRQ